MNKTVSLCRLCQSADIVDIWKFGNTPLANAFKNAKGETDFVAPLTYFKCNECHSVQLRHEVDSEILFKNYLYQSPPNLTSHFRELANSCADFLNLKKRSMIIDIGSNNGMLLSEFKSNGYRVLGIEPSNIHKIALEKGIPTINAFWDTRLSKSINYEDFLCPSLIVSTNTFAHLSDLHDFIEALEITMTDNSYFVFENAYLKNTLENHDFGQAYFEHFYLHSVAPLKRLFDFHGFELFKIEYVDVQMGSIRGYVRKKGNTEIASDGSVEKAIEQEKQFGMFSSKVFDNFIFKIQGIKDGLLCVLAQAKAEGKTVSVYGWPAKMTLINSYFGIEKYLDYIVEESNIKVGKIAPGTNLEVKSLDFFKSNPTDISLIGAYNFENDIKNKNKWYLGKWINPLEFQLI